MPTSALLRRIITDGVADGSFRKVSAAMVGRAVLSLLSSMARWFKPTCEASRATAHQGTILPLLFSHHRSRERACVEGMFRCLRE